MSFPRRRPSQFLAHQALVVPSQKMDFGGDFNGLEILRRAKVTDQINAVLAEMAEGRNVGLRRIDEIGCEEGEAAIVFSTDLATGVYKTTYATLCIEENHFKNIPVGEFNFTQEGKIVGIDSAKELHFLKKKSLSERLRTALLAFERTTPDPASVKTI